MSQAIFSWFGAAPVRFYLVAVSALFCFLTLAASHREPTAAYRSQLLFLISTAVVIFAWRWPVLIPSYALNVDEGMWVAGALKITVDPVPWRGFDAATSGPLGSYLLALPALFGCSIDFFSTRLIGTCLMTSAVLALYFALEWVYDARLAQLGIVPAVLLVALTDEVDFVHFSSEYLPVFLTTAALAGAAFVAAGVGSARARVIAAAAAGICLGSSVFAKLQATPIAALICCGLAVAIFLTRRGTKEAAVLLAIAALSLCAVPAVLMVWGSVAGNPADPISYFTGGLEYAASGGDASVGTRFFFGTVKSYAAFLIPALMAVGVGALALVRWRSIPRRALLVTAFSLLLVVAAWYSIYKPHRGFPHYLLFSVIPVSFCAAAFLALTREAALWQRERFWVPMTWLTVFTVPALSVALAAPNRFVSSIASHTMQPRPPEAEAVARYARRGDVIAVWGWAAELYGHTGTIMATRAADTAGLAVAGPNLASLRERYMSELQADKPKVFVDAVHPGAFFRMNDPATQRHENFPALADYIRENYTFKEEVNGVRIYVARNSGA